MEAFSTRAAFIGIAILSFLIFNTECWFYEPPFRQCRLQFESMRNLTNDILCRNRTWWSHKPVKDANTTLNVSIRYFPTYIDLDESDEVVTLDGFLNTTWKNEFVSWNSSEYGVSEITANGEYFWQPLASRRPYRTRTVGITTYYDYHTSFDEAVIRSNGLVSLKSDGKLFGPCKHDARAWPFGQWNCRLPLARVYENNKNVKLAPFDPLKDIDVSGLDDNGVWILVSRPHFRVVDSTNTTIEVSFAVKRNSLTYGSSIILPGVVTLLVSLASFWLTDRIYYRVIINTITATIQLALLLFMLWLLKESGTEGNLLMRLLENSAFVSLMGLLSAIVNAKLMRKFTEPPKYILRTIDGVGRVPYVGPIFHNFISDNNLVPEDDEVVLVATSEEDYVEWKVIRVALDRCIFILLVLHFLSSCLF